MEKENKRKLKIIFLLIGIFLLALLGASIIFDIIFLLSDWHPNIILRFIILYLFLEIILRFSPFGKEFNRLINKKKKFRL